MPTETVTQTTDKVATYADLAAELIRVAADLGTLGDQPCPTYFDLNMQPGKRGDDDQTRAAVDAVATALLGHPGKLQEMSNGTYQYTSSGRRGLLTVSIYQAVSNPGRDAELEALRAEVERLRNPTGLDFSREPDATDAGTVADGIEGGPVVGRAAGVCPPDWDCAQNGGE